MIRNHSQIRKPHIGCTAPTNVFLNIYICAFQNTLINLPVELEGLEKWKQTSRKENPEPLPASVLLHIRVRTNLGKQAYAKLVVTLIIRLWQVACLLKYRNNALISHVIPSVRLTDLSWRRCNMSPCERVKTRCANLGLTLWPDGNWCGTQRDYTWNHFEDGRSLVCRPPLNRHTDEIENNWNVILDRCKTLCNKQLGDLSGCKYLQRCLEALQPVDVWRNL